MGNANPLSASLLLWLGVGASLASATDVVYVTDLTIFTELAPCAASAVSYNVFSMTYEACPQGVTELQSCVCSKDNNFASLKTQLSASVSYSCGATATADQSSATAVYEAYCNQASITPFPSPSVTVSQYVTDFPAWADLAPCAQSALSYNVFSMTYDLCPSDPNLLATCVCAKNQNSLRVSQGINTSVKYGCSSHSADLSSAQAVFAAYCGLNNGTTSFPTASNPPGDMTYYITAMAEYASLAPCARSAVSYGVFSQTYELCPNGPQALASCACIKDAMPGVVSSAITSGVKYSCSNTASEDITSALSVWDVYCSAAKALVTPSGVTESVSQTGATAKTGTGAGGSSPTNTGTGSSGSGGSSGSSGSNSSGGAAGTTGTNGAPTSSGGASSDSKNNTGVIAGAVVGVVLGLALIGAGVFLIRRHQRAKNARLQQSTGPAAGAGGSEHPGKSELDNTFVAPAAAAASPGTLKPAVPSRTDNVSPISATGTGAYSPHPHPELQGQHAFRPGQPQQSELYGQNAVSPQAPYANHPELPGQHPYSHQTSPAAEAYGHQIYEAAGQQRPPAHEAPGQNMNVPQGAGWQSSPVPSYHEMDGGWTGQVRHGQR